MSNDHPHDTLFKQAMSRPELAASELRVALGPTLSARIDWSTLALLPVETSTQPSGHTRTPDLLFVAHRTGESPDDVLVYLLFEHHSTQSKLMPLRLLGYMVDAWTRWEKRTRKPGRRRPPLPPILPVVLSHAPGGWRGPARLVELCRFSDDDLDLFAPFVPDFRYLVDDLAKTSQLELLTERDLEPAVRLVLWVLRDARGGDGILHDTNRLFALLEVVAERGLAMDLIDAAFSYLSVVLPESGATDLAALARAAAPAYPRGASVAMNSLQKLIEQGRQEGRQEGRLEGRQEGRQEGRRETAAKMLRRLLEGRFGPLTSAQHSRIDVLDATSLEDALERILTADSIEAVIG